MTESSELGAHLAAVRAPAATQPAPPAAGQPRRHPRAGARQGHHHRRRHPGEPARHRAAHHQDPAADRLGRQGPGDGHRLVAQRPDADPAASRTWPRRTVGCAARSRSWRRGPPGARRAVAVGQQVTLMAERGRYLFAVTRGLAAAGPRGRHRAGRRAARRGRARTAWPRSSATSTWPSSARRGCARNLEDLAWLEEVARRHDDVVHAVAAARPDRAAAAGHHLPRRRRGAQPARRVARRPRGRRSTGSRAAAEWSVKAYARPRAAAAGNGATRRDRARRRRGLPAAQAGADRRAPQPPRRRACTAATQIHAAWPPRAVASPAAGRAGPAAHRARGHDDAQRRLPRRGRRTPTRSWPRRSGRPPTHAEHAVEVHGPWPPYSFATLDQP